MQIDQSNTLLIAMPEFHTSPPKQIDQQFQHFGAGMAAGFSPSAGSQVESSTNDNIIQSSCVNNDTKLFIFGIRVL